MAAARQEREEREKRECTEREKHTRNTQNDVCVYPLPLLSFPLLYQPLEPFLFLSPLRNIGEVQLDAVGEGRGIDSAVKKEKEQ